jgi:RNAse (barnase) inhibitor barstar
MDLSAANALVMVVSENFAQYPIETQRSLLEGIFQLADECQENLDDLPDTLTNEHLRTNLVLAKLLTSQALKNGALREGFSQAAQCFWPMAAPNFDNCGDTNPSQYDESLFPG